MRNSLSFLLLVLFIPSIIAQSNVDPGELPDYAFINYKSNRFELIQNNLAYNNLYAKFDSLIKTGNNQIRIVHIGGSHIQADIYTHRIRQEMQSFYPGILGSRGFFFPYKLAKTNSPSNLWIKYSGDWQTSKNTQPEPIYPLGLSGITSELHSNEGSLTVVARYDTVQHYDFNRIRIFCNIPATGCSTAIITSGKVSKTNVNNEASYIEYLLSEYTDTLQLTIRQDSSQKPFQLYGISLENDDPGVIYSSIGVNGAMLKSYLKCGMFGRQLASLRPDWIIISIGTNEGNTRTFNKEAYYNEYIRLLDSVKAAIPNAAILLTVPNDCYYHRKYINYNTPVIRETIFDLARKSNCGVWDFYTVMGGLNSVRTWYNNGLMGNDHIHFNKPGYLLKGELFYSAFLNSWNHPSSSPDLAKPDLSQHLTSPEAISVQ